MAKFKLLLIVAIGFFVLSSCKNEPKKEAIALPVYHKISGKTMGTYYNITFESSLPDEFIQLEIDSLLNVFENDLSTYRPNSIISKFNAEPGSIEVDTATYFYRSFKSAEAIYLATDGYYDPTIAPLVNFWGFGSDNQSHKSQELPDTIKSILKLVGYDKIVVELTENNAKLVKVDSAQKLDLNASAKGMGVDIAATLLESKSIINYLVEIGGEVRAKGKNASGEIWTLGINKPSQDASLSDILLPVIVNNKGMATSGNYRQFYKDGQLTFAHIINPKTGESKPTDLLSATVIANDCQTADGYATALMAMGLEKSKALVEQLPNIETCLIYHDKTADTLAFYYSSGFEKNIKK